ncbi:MAG: DUF1772 domain-containing protein [Caldilineaceae bacterium]|nr:DUF1772 domain-containing protein [Caldilineaceae bacterium]MCB9157037.1 DUF1772 domain-containing protein [Caldilineaceae bacterium]
MQKRSLTYIENGFLALATLVFGIMAGLFWTYTFNVNYAMLEVDGATYATVQSLLNQNVRHFMFFLFFFGGGFFSVLALAVNWRHWRHMSFWLLALAAIIYILGVIVFTAQVNLPLNYYTESWDPQNLPADWAQVRTQWNNANAIRVGTSGAAFVLALAALVVRASRNAI